MGLAVPSTRLLHDLNHGKGTLATTNASLQQGPYFPFVFVVRRFSQNGHSVRMSAAKGNLSAHRRFNAAPYTDGRFDGLHRSNRKSWSMSSYGPFMSIDTKGGERTFAASAHQGLVCAAVSTGRRNTLIFRKRWSVPNEVSSPSIFHR